MKPFYCRLGEWPFSVFLYWVIFFSKSDRFSPKFTLVLMKGTFLSFLLLRVGLMCESSSPTRSRSVHPQRNTFLSSIEIPHDWNCPRWKHIIAIHGSWTAPIGRFGPCQASGLAREPPGRPGLMSPWASKPRGPVAQGNVANQGSTLAVLPPSPLPLALGLL